MHDPSVNTVVLLDQGSDGPGRRPDSIPARAGIGLRMQHHAPVLQDLPNVAWLEVHSENYFGDGGPARDCLLAIREHYPLSLHGVGLSLGSTDNLNQQHLEELGKLIALVEPSLVSEHLCWSSVKGQYFNDLLPMPYSAESLRHMCRRVDAVQEYLGRRILIENVSSYFYWADGEFTEWDFLAELQRRSGCGILLDINNIYVNAMNHGIDAGLFVRSMPSSSVLEMHLAGHSVSQLNGNEVYIDTHNQQVAEPVWDLYMQAVQHHGRVPTLIEWDADIPELGVLVEQARTADHYAVCGYAQVA